MKLRFAITVFCVMVITETSMANQPLRPRDMDTINYTEVLFQWQASMNAEGYHLQIASEDAFEQQQLIHDFDITTNAVIVSNGIDWETNFYWRYWSLDIEGNSVDTSSIYSFSTIALPDTFSTIEVEIFDRDQIQPGLTIFGNGRDFISAIDIDGNVKLHLTGGVDVTQLIGGDILSISHAHALRTTLDGDTTYRSPQGSSVHHSVDIMPNGHYLTLSQLYQWVPAPDRENVSLYYRGDVIYEYNGAGDIVWSWDTHEFFSYEDAEPHELEITPDWGIFDWTHSNAVQFTPDMSAIYLSSRALSRITLIDYETKEVIWNMGKEFASGEVDFGHDLNFSYQHAPEWLPNGNILLFDNHNLGHRDSSRAIEISIDLDRDPVAEIVWEAWRAPYSGSQGDADRLPNGNTLINMGATGEIYEVNEQSEDVWKLTRTRPEGDDRFGIYRAERVPNLFPLAYTVKGPNNGDHIPAGDSYFVVTINNIGNRSQAFRYNITDSEGWFEVVDGYRRVEAGESSTLIIRGQTGNGAAVDTLNIEIYPVSKSSQVDTWTSVVISDETLSLKKSETELYSFQLFGSYPNPFNNQTMIRFSVDQTGPTSLDIIGIDGRHIKNLLSETLIAGEHNILWDGSNESGNTVTAGTYIYKLQYGDNFLSKSVVLLK